MKFFITLFTLVFSLSMSASENTSPRKSSRTLPFLTKAQFKVVDSNVDTSWEYVTAVCAQSPDITNFVLTSEEVREVVEDAVWQANVQKRLASLKKFIADNYPH